MSKRVNFGHAPEPEQKVSRNRMVPSLNSMTPQQMVFADEYLIDLNPTQAAIRAGYPPDKAAYAARTVMKHPPVHAYIAKAMAARAKRTGITADRVLDRLGAIVMGDPRKIFNAEGGLRKPYEMDKDDALMLAGVKTSRRVRQGVDENGSVVMEPEEITEIKTVDMLAALSLAMKHLGMLNDKLDIHVTHSLADRLTMANKRLQDARGKGAVTIEGEFTDDGLAALEQLEQDSQVLNKQLAYEHLERPQINTLTLDDIW
jgi:phage terminase small subunit